MKVKIENVFNKPKTIGIMSDVNEGKSNLIYHLIDELKQYGKFNLYIYGLRNMIGNAREIFSVAELEKIKNSIIIVDECFSLFDLDNRKCRKQIENTLRLINHNNNILVLVGVPENFKKFISGKLDMIFFKRVSYSDLINGSSAKNVVMNYKGVESGSTILDIEVGKTLLFDGWGYEMLDVPYMREYDSKKSNKQIVTKKVQKVFVKKFKKQSRGRKMEEKERRLYNSVNEIVQDGEIEVLEEELDNLAVELFDSENNYNNCDKTSNQKVNTLEEIKKNISIALKGIKENTDNCSSCGKALQDDDFITESNRVPYGDTYADEQVIVGCVCSKCGEEEDY